MKETAPLRNPDFLDGAFLNGLPLATRQDLAEVKRTWNQQLPDKVLELVLNGGQTTGGAASGGSLDSLATRIAMTRTVNTCPISQVMDNNTFDMLPGGFTFPGGTDNAVPNIIQTTLLAPLFVRALAPKWLGTYDSAGNPKEDQTIYSFMELRWDWVVTGNRYLSMHCDWQHWKEVSRDTFLQSGTDADLRSLRASQFLSNKYTPVLAPTATGTFSSATLTDDIKARLGTVSGDWRHFTKFSEETTILRKRGRDNDPEPVVITNWNGQLKFYPQEWFNGLNFPIDFLALAAR